MEIKIQRCQNCGSRNLRNILVRDEDQKVFVQCRDCESLVARYVLEDRGYYHAGKDFESFLRSIERTSGASSGRDIHIEFEETKVDTKKQFAEVSSYLTNKYKGSKLP